eukprot:gnl/Chilomastix_cuspidata/3581.p1 GENE.gnl/Chilomastix_cuspidata/3581~~gnl/Chilomastix_cuspidata/3581.p1  ORF type:complete len:2609 (-),score=676.97 gnl/Chilomastix_cuspidata/3581:1812-9638(-)
MNKSSSTVLQGEQGICLPLVLSKLSFFKRPMLHMAAYSNESAVTSGFSKLCAGLFYIVFLILAFQAMVFYSPEIALSARLRSIFVIESVPPKRFLERWSYREVCYLTLCTSLPITLLLLWVWYARMRSKRTRFSRGIAFQIQQVLIFLVPVLFVPLFTRMVDLINFDTMSFPDGGRGLCLHEFRAYCLLQGPHRVVTAAMALVSSTVLIVWYLWLWLFYVPMIQAALPRYIRTSRFFLLFMCILEAEIAVNSLSELHYFNAALTLLLNLILLRTFCHEIPFVLMPVNSAMCGVLFFMVVLSARHVMSVLLPLFPAYAFVHNSARVLEAFGPAHRAGIYALKACECLASSDAVMYAIFPIAFFCGIRKMHVTTKRHIDSAVLFFVVQRRLQELDIRVNANPKLRSLFNIGMSDTFKNPFKFTCFHSRNSPEGAHPQNDAPNLRDFLHVHSFPLPLPFVYSFLSSFIVNVKILYHLPFSDLSNMLNPTGRPRNDLHATPRTQPPEGSPGRSPRDSRWRRYRRIVAHTEKPRIVARCIKKTYEKMECRCFKMYRQIVLLHMTSVLLEAPQAFDENRDEIIQEILLITKQIEAEIRRGMYRGDAHPRCKSRRCGKHKPGVLNTLKSMFISTQLTHASMPYRNATGAYVFCSWLNMFDKSRAGAFCEGISRGQRAHSSLPPLYFKFPFCSQLLYPKVSQNVVQCAIQRYVRIRSTSKDLPECIELIRFEVLFMQHFSAGKKIFQISRANYKLLNKNKKFVSDAHNPLNGTMAKRGGDNNIMKKFYSTVLNTNTFYSQSFFKTSLNKKEKHLLLLLETQPMFMRIAICSILGHAFGAYELEGRLQSELATSLFNSYNYVMSQLCKTVKVSLSNNPFDQDFGSFEVPHTLLSKAFMRTMSNTSLRYIRTTESLLYLEWLNTLYKKKLLLLSPRHPFNCTADVINHELWDELSFFDHAISKCFPEHVLQDSGEPIKRLVSPKDLFANTKSESPLTLKRNQFMFWFYTVLGMLMLVASGLSAFAMFHSFYEKPVTDSLRISHTYLETSNILHDFHSAVAQLSDSSQAFFISALTFQENLDLIANLSKSLSDVIEDARLLEVGMHIDNTYKSKHFIQKSLNQASNGLFINNNGTAFSKTVNYPAPFFSFEALSVFQLIHKIQTNIDEILRVDREQFRSWVEENSAAWSFLKRDSFATGISNALDEFSFFYTNIPETAMALHSAALKEISSVDSSVFTQTLFSCILPIFLFLLCATFFFFMAFYHWSMPLFSKILWVSTLPTSLHRPFHFQVGGALCAKLDHFRTRFLNTSTRPREAVTESSTITQSLSSSSETQFHPTTSSLDSADSSGEKGSESNFPQLHDTNKKFKIFRKAKNFSTILLLGVLGFYLFFLVQISVVSANTAKYLVFSGNFMNSTSAFHQSDGLTSLFYQLAKQAITYNDTQAREFVTEIIETRNIEHVFNNVFVSPVTTALISNVSAAHTETLQSIHIMFSEWEIAASIIGPESPLSTIDGEQTFDRTTETMKQAGRINEFCYFFPEHGSTGGENFTFCKNLDIESDLLGGMTRDERMAEALRVLQLGSFHDHYQRIIFDLRPETLSSTIFFVPMFQNQKSFFNEEEWFFLSTFDLNVLLQIPKHIKAMRGGAAVTQLEFSFSDNIMDDVDSLRSRDYIFSTNEVYETVTSSETVAARSTDFGNQHFSYTMFRLVMFLGLLAIGLASASYLLRQIVYTTTECISPDFRGAPRWRLGRFLWLIRKRLLATQYCKETIETHKYPHYKFVDTLNIHDRQEGKFFQKHVFDGSPYFVFHLFIFCIFLIGLCVFATIQTVGSIVLVSRAREFQNDAVNARSLFNEVDKMIFLAEKLERMTMKGTFSSDVVQNLFALQGIEEDLCRFVSANDCKNLKGTDSSTWASGPLSDTAQRLLALIPRDATHLIKADMLEARKISEDGVFSAQLAARMHEDAFISDASARFHGMLELLAHVSFLARQAFLNFATANRVGDDIERLNKLFNVSLPVEPSSYDDLFPNFARYCVLERVNCVALAAVFDTTSDPPAVEDAADATVFIDRALTIVGSQEFNFFTRNARYQAALLVEGLVNKKSEQVRHCQELFERFFATPVAMSLLSIIFFNIFVPSVVWKFFSSLLSSLSANNVMGPLLDEAHASPPVIQEGLEDPPRASSDSASSGDKAQVPEDLSRISQSLAPTVPRFTSHALFQRRARRIQLTTPERGGGSVVSQFALLLNIYKILPRYILRAASIVFVVLQLLLFATLLAARSLLHGMPTESVVHFTTFMQLKDMMCAATQATVSGNFNAGNGLDFSEQPWTAMWRDWGQHAERCLFSSFQNTLQEPTKKMQNPIPERFTRAEGYFVDGAIGFVPDNQLFESGLDAQSLLGAYQKRLLLFQDLFTIPVNFRMYRRGVRGVERTFYEPVVLQRPDTQVFLARLEEAARGRSTIPPIASFDAALHPLNAQASCWDTYAADGTPELPLRLTMQLLLEHYDALVTLVSTELGDEDASERVQKQLDAHTAFAVDYVKARDALESLVLQTLRSHDNGVAHLKIALGAFTSAFAILHLVVFIVSVVRINRFNHSVQHFSRAITPIYRKFWHDWYTLEGPLTLHK